MYACKSSLPLSSLSNVCLCSFFCRTRSKSTSTYLNIYTYINTSNKPKTIHFHCFCFQQRFSILKRKAISSSRSVPMEISLFKAFRSFLLVLFIAVFEYQRGSFTRSGVITGFIVCFFISYSNIVFLFVMVTFVLSGSISTRYKFDMKQLKISEDDQLELKRPRKKTARNSVQVLSNGAVACVFALGYCWKTNFSGISLPIDFKHESSIYSIGFIVSIACCCGDTLGKLVVFFFFEWS